VEEPVNTAARPWRWPLVVLTILIVVVIAGVLLSLSGCSTGTYPPAEPEKCGNGEGHWIEDDNGWMQKTRVTVRLCISENGQVLGMEVN
jgi:hypothetical protein